MKKHDPENDEDIKIRNSDLYVRPKEEKKPAKVYGILFILLCLAAVFVLLSYDSEPEAEDSEDTAEIAVTSVIEKQPEEPREELQEQLQEEPQAESAEAPVAQDAGQQPVANPVEYRRYEINSIVYEVRNDAAFVIGTVGNTKNVKYLTIESSVIYSYPVVEICEGAFSGCGKLQRVHIPDSVIVIRKSAFENCKRLEYVRMSEGLITIEPRVFAGCSSLKSLKFPATVKELRAEDFEGDTSLTKLRIPESCRIPEGEDPFGLGKKLKIEIY